MSIFYQTCTYWNSGCINRNIMCYHTIHLRLCIFTYRHFKKHCIFTAKFYISNPISSYVALFFRLEILFTIKKLVCQVQKNLKKELSNFIMMLFFYVPTYISTQFRRTTKQNQKYFVSKWYFFTLQNISYILTIIF